MPEPHPTSTTLFEGIVSRPSHSSISSLARRTESSDIVPTNLRQFLPKEKVTLSGSTRGAVTISSPAVTVFAVASFVSCFIIPFGSDSARVIIFGLEQRLQLRPLHKRTQMRALCCGCPVTKISPIREWPRCYSIQKTILSSSQPTSHISYAQISPSRHKPGKLKSMQVYTPAEHGFEPLRL